MSEPTQLQEIAASLQRLSQVLSDTVSMALEGFAAAQAQGRTFLETALEQVAANARESMRYTEELRNRFAEAIEAANKALKDQAAVLAAAPTDPMAATQKMLAGQIESARRALEMGSEALKNYVNLVNDFWSRLEQTSRDTRASYVDFIGKLQAIVEARARKL
jgi:hypothetical protein